ncbi:cation:dicarboxylase symporter family transporter [Pseudomonas entomophila]|uniref:cation:dicarboxylate symporter family transporter n=1 Tax=Pseudomonas sp. RIT-PI-S TaxID=3035295 RepID=UPI0021DB6125
MAIVLGALLGLAAPQQAVAMKPLCDGFIRIVTWMMPFILFLLVSSAAAGLRQHRQGAGLTLKALSWFQAMTWLAVLIGTVSALAMNLGSEQGPAPGVHGQIAGALANVTAMLSASRAVHVMLAGIACGLLCGRSARLRQGLERGWQGCHALFRLVLRFTPLAAFSAVAFTVGRYGAVSLWPMFKFLAIVHLACGLFVTLVLNTTLRWLGVPLWSLLRHLRQELVLVLTTGASLAALPGLAVKLEQLGCRRETTRLILTAGYTFNLSGSVLYLTCAVLFLIGQAHIALTTTDVLTVMALVGLGSLGSTSVAGSSFLTLVATLQILGLGSVEGLGLLLGVERLMKCRLLTNVLGNCVACLVVNHWQGTLTQPTLRRALGLTP